MFFCGITFQVLTIDKISSVSTFNRSFQLLENSPSFGKVRSSSGYCRVTLCKRQFNCGSVPKLKISSRNPRRFFTTSISSFIAYSRSFCESISVLRIQSALATSEIPPQYCGIFNPLNKDLRHIAAPSPIDTESAD